MMMVANWLGFFDLDVMISGIMMPEVYVIATAQPSPAYEGSSLERSDHNITVCGFDSHHGHAVIRYWTMRIGSQGLNCGAPIDAAMNRLMIARSAAAECFLTGWLRTRRIVPIRATLARPNGFTYLDGDPSWIDYDPETNTFQEKERLL